VVAHVLHQEEKAEIETRVNPAAVHSIPAHTDRNLGQSARL
jgi:hypothetical protein